MPLVTACNPASFVFLCNAFTAFRGETLLWHTAPMHARPTTRLWTTLTVVLCLLWAQLVLVAYVCPQWVQPVAVAAMPGCDAMEAAQMDPDQPVLCQAAADASPQSAHQSSGVDLPSPVWAALWTLAWLLPLLALTALAVPVARPVRPFGGPPLYLFHQVFRL